MPVDDLNDPTARATNWARAQIGRRREMEDREVAWHKAHPMAHPWKVDPPTIARRVASASQDEEKEYVAVTFCFPGMTITGQGR